MKIQLSDHFTYGKLLRFTLPSIIMMVFTSIYGVVDGIFVSNFAGKTAFSAVNLIMPYLMVFGTLGFMVGTGGTALISMSLGMGNKQRANELFSMLFYFSIIGGIILTVISIAFLRPVAMMLGADGQMLEDCVTYGTIVQSVLTVYVLQYAFQSFCVAAEKANLSLIMTVTAGVCNMALDALFVVAFRWGLVGAAVATAISQVIGAVIPIVYFSRPNSSLLRLGRPRLDLKALLRACANGSSELMGNISMAVVGMLYNVQLFAYAGQDGIAAYGVIMYVNFVFISIFIGFAIGTAPIIGYNYGAANHRELKNLTRKCLSLLAAAALCMAGIGLALSSPLSGIFVGYDADLKAMTAHGFSIYSLSYLLCGFNIYGSSMFTALSNGLVSAVISFVRTLICQISAVLLLPTVLGLDGIWWAIVAAELTALTLTAIFFFALRKKYRYA